MNFMGYLRCQLVPGKSEIRHRTPSGILSATVTRSGTQSVPCAQHPSGRTKRLQRRSNRSSFVGIVFRSFHSDKYASRIVFVLVFLSNDRNPTIPVLFALHDRFRLRVDHVEVPTSAVGADKAPGLGVRLQVCHHLLFFCSVDSFTRSRDRRSSCPVPNNTDP